MTAPDFDQDVYLTEEARRYLDLTRAHHMLTDLARIAGNLSHIANNRTVLADGGDGEVPVRDALVSLRDEAGRAATGSAEPLDTDAWKLQYDAELRSHLGRIAHDADTVANAARAVTGMLDAGLVTATRAWSPDEIADGAMLEHLDVIDTECGDAARLWGCMTALRLRLDGEDITEAVYDRHMERVAAIWNEWPIAAARPERTARLVADALDAWREHYESLNSALDGPMPFSTAGRLINQCGTFARLTCYAVSITGPAWSEDTEDPDNGNARHSANRLMMALARRYHTMSDTDAAGVHRSTAPALSDIIEQWRSATVDDARVHADTLDVEAYDDDDLPDVLTDAYRHLYQAAGAAVTVTELVALWHACDVFTGETETDYAHQVRVMIALRFDADNGLPGIGVRIDDTDRETTRELRRLVDELDMPSNALQTMAYRGHAAALDDLDMRNPGALTPSTALDRIWEEIVDDAGAARITRRQLAALRNLANVKIAEYCDGDEYRAAAIAARLTDWDRIGDELAA